MKKPKGKKRKTKKAAKRTGSRKELLADASQFERIAKRLYEMLSPDCVVTHNDKIMGSLSKSNRQIDVSIRGLVAGHELLIIVNTKNQQSRVDVNKVGELSSVMKDVGAHRGVIICNKGFTSGAKNSAKQCGIDLCQIHDAETRNWKLAIKFPIIWEELAPTFNVNWTAHLLAGMQLNEGSILTVSGINLREKFAMEWNSGRIALDGDPVPYSHGIVNPTITTLNGDIVPLTMLSVSIAIARTYYFGYFDQLPKAKALVNATSGKTNMLISSADVGNIDRGSLARIGSLDDAPVPIAEHLRVLMSPTIRFPMQNGRIEIRRVGD